MGEKGKGGKERKIYYLIRTKILMRKRRFNPYPNFRSTADLKLGLL